MAAPAPSASIDRLNEAFNRPFKSNDLGKLIAFNRSKLEAPGSDLGASSSQHVEASSNSLSHFFTTT